MNRREFDTRVARRVARLVELSVGKKPKHTVVLRIVRRRMAEDNGLDGLLRCDAVDYIVKHDWAELKESAESKFVKVKS